MALGHSPRMVTNGLVLYYDAANASKNATANISTNLITNGNFAGGQGSPLESGSNPTNTIIQMANPGDTGWVLRQNGNFTEYQLNPTGLAANTTYVMSGWYAKSPDYVDADVMFHARAFSTSGAHTSTGFGAGTLLYSTVVNGITWQFRYQTITTPADANGAFNWYVGYGVNNTVGFRYYTNLRMERGTYPSLQDLSGNNNIGEASNGVLFDSANAGSLVFDGVDDRVSVPDNSSLDLAGDKTLTCWVFMGANSSGCGICGKSNSTVAGMALGYGWDGNGFMALAWNSSNSPFLSKDLSRDISKWVCLTAVQEGTVRTIYVYDSVGLRSSTSTSGTHSWNNSQSFMIGNANNGANFAPANTRIAITMVYNRALSSAEVKRNFDATRSRFGL